MSSGAALVQDAKIQYGRELSLIQSQGNYAFHQMTKDLNPSELGDEAWEIKSRYLLALLAVQHRAGQQASLDYLTNVGTAAGFPPGVAMPSQISQDRVGRLPSGLVAAALFTTVPMAVAHRTRMGYSGQEAWDKSYNLMGRAVREAAWHESRATITDSLKTERIDWETLDAKYEKSRFENRREKATYDRERAYYEDHRRMMRNKSAQQKNRMGWGMSPSDPLITRYSRVPSPGACSFCLMLATKGAVYYKDSFSNGRSSSSEFNALGDARVHLNCKCRLIAEAYPGAYKDTIFGSAEDFAKAQWTDHRYNRTYVLKNLVEGKIVVPDLSPMDVTLVA